MDFDKNYQKAYAGTEKTLAPVGLTPGKVYFRKKSTGMPKKKIEVRGLKIQIDTVKNSEYVSLTDIAKQTSDEPRFTIRNWMSNKNTLRYLGVWEEIHNPDFKRAEFRTFKESYFDSSSFSMTPEKWSEATNALGIISKRGRGGGTYAHKDIAINFCYWLEPEFQVYFIKAFQELMQREFSRQNLEWHISKITDNIDEIRNLLDTIPGQLPERNRLKYLKDIGEGEE